MDTTIQINSEIEHFLNMNMMYVAFTYNLSCLPDKVLIMMQHNNRRERTCVLSGVIVLLCV